MTSVQKIQPDALIYYQNWLNDIKQLIVSVRLRMGVHDERNNASAGE